MILTQIEAESALWKSRIEPELKSRLSVLREMNDGSHSAEDTAKIRGRISEIKAMLDWVPMPAEEILD